MKPITFAMCSSSGIPSSAQSLDVAFAPTDFQFYSSTRLTIPIVPDTRPHAAHH